ncbi:unnamed protein product [Gongylonema pulchrum]|uniref:Uncharacterized protein n=1 Tax=Gongylonema pulchrum TaxID=637853 RepID=A0A3P7RN81_9BILA|nr:unnamed protein product [Gongylonema pulchrum]
MLSGYIASSVRAVRNYLYEYGTTNNYALMGTDSYFRSNVCFQAVQKIPQGAAHADNDNEHQQLQSACESWGFYGPLPPPPNQYTEIRRPAARNSEPTVRCPVINRRQHQSHALRQVKFLHLSVLNMFFFCSNR